MVWVLDVPTDNDPDAGENVCNAGKREKELDEPSIALRQTEELIQHLKNIPSWALLQFEKLNELEELYKFVQATES